MKKQFTIFLVAISSLAFGILGLTNQVFAETEVSGNITSDTTWISSDSPYIITDTVQVLEGVKLTIDPGVIIRARKEKQLNIDGSIQAVGTNENFITFTSYDENGWEGLYFTSKTSNINISNCIFQNADNALYFNNNAPVTIKNNIFRYNAGAITGAGNAKELHIVNNTFYKNSAAFFRILMNNNSTINDNNFIDNDYIFRVMYDYAGDINITNNNFLGNQLFEGLLGHDMNMANNWWGTTDVSKIDSMIIDYFDDIRYGKVNYAPIATEKFGDYDSPAITFINTCSSFTYSNWSTCSANGTQTRSITTSFPNGCTGGNPVLTQTCIYIPPVCASWTYSDWGTCVNGQQARTIASSYPANCAGGNPVLTQSCTYTPPACTSWTYSEWNVCANSQQSRTVISSQPTNCAGGNPMLNQSCNSTPLCTGNNWTLTLTPINCPNSGQQIKKWTKIGQCQGGVSQPIEEIISCDYQLPTCTSFVYKDWSACNTSGVQLRSILSSSPSGCIGGNPTLSQNCNYNSDGTLNKGSSAEAKDNLSESTKNQDLQNVKIPQDNQIQNTSTQIKNNVLEVNQKKDVTGSQLAEQRKNEVASATQQILQIAEKDSGIGQQMKTIAQTQTQNQEKLEASLQKVQNRGGFAKFFIGPDYNEINNAKKLLEQNREQIQQLSQIKNQLTNQDDQQKLTEQIQLFEQSNQEIEGSLNTSQKSFSLLGWLFKLFAK